MNAVRLQRTDQLDCFDEDGNRIDCSGSGQDGEFNTTDPRSGDRFAVIDAVVEDRWTGLLWPVCASVTTFPLTWKEALAFVAEMNRSQHLGRSDWRIPSRADLFSLISHAAINPALPQGHPFTDVFNGYYWTATPCARLPDQAWYIHLGGARVQRGMMHGSYMVWPVAGIGSGLDLPGYRFVAAAHTIQDRLLHRTWLSDPRRDPPRLRWCEALDQVRRLNRERVEGCSDWRLPNIRELESLIDVTVHSPAFSPQYPLQAVREGYWSSTTSRYEPRYAWVLYAQDGAVGVGYKPQRDFSLLVIR